jgi:hypothetical protein
MRAHEDSKQNCVINFGYIHISRPSQLLSFCNAISLKDEGVAWSRGQICVVHGVLKADDMIEIENR